MRSKKTLIKEIERTKENMNLIEVAFHMGRTRRSQYEWDMNYLSGRLSALEFMLGFEKFGKGQTLALLDNANTIHSVV